MSEQGATRRYKLTVWADDYSYMESLLRLAALVPDAETRWEVRDDETLALARAVASEKDPA